MMPVPRFATFLLTRRRGPGPTTAPVNGDRLSVAASDAVEAAKAAAQAVEAAKAAAQAVEAARAAAQAAEARAAVLEQRFEGAMDAFVAVDENSLIVDWNAEAEQLFGFTRAEVLGQQLILSPTNEEAVEERFGHLAQDQETLRRRMIVPIVHRHGHSLSVELTAWSTVQDGAVIHNAFFRPLTSTNPASQMCQHGSIVESSEAAIISEGIDGRIQTWNLAAEQVYGYRAAEMLGQPATVIVPDDRMVEVQGLCEAARGGRAAPNHDTVRRRKDASLVDVAVTISPVYDPAGQVAGVSTIARDITEQRRLATALEAALEEARQAEARSRRFLADAAHQIRNPLASVRACADALLLTSSVDGRERLLAHLIDETARASRLVSSLLRMARLDRGELPTPAPCDLVRLCEREAERTRVQSPAIEIVVQADAVVERSVYLDGDIVGEILANLLDNARRYATERIEIVVCPVHDGVEVHVVDDGPGLHAEMAELAFERFASLDGKGGSGLGLPIARTLARSHGGELSYRSGEFLLSLPLDGSTRGSSARRRPTVPASAATSEHPLPDDGTSPLGDLHIDANDRSARSDTHIAMTPNEFRLFMTMTGNQP